VNAFVRAIERRERFEGGYAAETEPRAERAAHPGFPTGGEDWAKAMPDRPHCAWLEPIREGYLTQSDGGRPLASLIGAFKDYGGAQTVVFMPVTPVYTEVVLSSLVHEDAEPGRDYDIERLRWMWHETTVQDTKLIGNNRAGVNSRRYLPDPYGTGERGAEGFVHWYLEQIAG
jgi:Rieske 2Fe-2S family protein